MSNASSTKEQGQQQQHNHHIHSRRLKASITNSNQISNDQINSPTRLHSQPDHVRRNRIWSILFIFLTPTTFFFFLLFTQISIVPPSTRLEKNHIPISATIRGSKFKFQLKHLNSNAIHPLQLSTTNGSSSPIKDRLIPNSLNILFFFYPSVETNSLDRLHSILKNFPPHSLTIICSPSLECPEILNSPAYRSFGSLDAYEPPLNSDLILVLDSDSLFSLDHTWLSNVARIILNSPRIVAVAGITLSSTPSNALMTCATRKGVASIALAPFVFPTRSWQRTQELGHITTSLDLSLHLATHLDWPSIVFPLENPISHSISQLCHNSIQKLIEIRAQSSNERINKWPQNLDPKVGILVTQTQLNLSDCSILACKLVQKFNAQIYFLQETDKSLGASEKLTLKKIIQNTCNRDIEINFVKPANNVHTSESQIQVAIAGIIQAQNTLELIFYFFDRNDSPLPQSFKKFHHPSQDSSKTERFDEDFNVYIENEPIQSETKPKDALEECVLICLPVQEILAADWILGLNLQALKNWHKPQIDISVITNDRSESLKRLLNSLEKAAYYGDRVNIVINMEQTSDQKTRKLVEKFRWKFGSKAIRQRIIQGGLLAAVVESWYPSSAHNSYGVLLEDDVEVSGYFYGWLKFSLLNYRYSGTIHDQIYGISLYQPQHNELRPEGRRPFNASQILANLGVEPPTMPYGSQVPCSWGALFFPEPWVEFQKYLTFRLSDSLIGVKLEDTVIPSPIRSIRWSKSWKKYMIEWVYLRGLIMIYPNYHERQKLNDLDRTNYNGADTLLVPTGLSTNHLEFGTHVHNRRLRKTRDRKKNRFSKWDDSLFFKNDEILELGANKEMMIKLEKLKKEFGIKLKKLGKTSSLLEGLGVYQDHNLKMESQDHMPEEVETTMTVTTKLPNLNQLVVLDLWGEVSNLVEIKYRGLMGALASGICDEFESLVDFNRDGNHLNSPSSILIWSFSRSFHHSFSSEYLQLLSSICQ